MEMDLGGSMCALDNPVVGGMQLFLLVNGILCAFSAVVLCFLRVRRLPALPSWCRAYSTAALSVHAFWAALTGLVLWSVFSHSADEALVFLSSLAFASVAGPSAIGLFLAAAIRRRAATDWTPPLIAGPTTAPGASRILPHA